MQEYLTNTRTYTRKYKHKHTWHTPALHFRHVEVLKENIKDMYEYSYAVCQDCQDYGELQSHSWHGWHYTLITGVPITARPSCLALSNIKHLAWVLTDFLFIVATIMVIMIRNVVITGVPFDYSFIMHYGTPLKIQFSLENIIITKP